MKKIILGIFVILSACTNKKQTENNESYEKKISDFNIQFENTHGIEGLINLFGMESPGLTSSLAIGDYIREKMNEYK